MSREFVHLHVHTDYSLLESNIRVEPLAKKLVELEMPGCAVTDRGNLYGAMAFYATLKAQNLKPVFGYEAFLTFGDRRDKQASVNAGERPFYELVLLATDLQGYRNLTELASKAFTEGFYHKPRLDCELLDRHKAGLIALSGGLKGVASHFLAHDNPAAAAAKINLLREIFGRDNFFLEIQDQALSVEKNVRRAIVELARRTDVPLVATSDVYYLTKADARAHEVLLCIGAGQTVGDASRPQLGSDQFYLRSAEEMWRLFGDELPDALRRTTEIFARCQPELPKADDKDYLPQYPIPIEAKCDNEVQYFEKVVWEGFNARRFQMWETGWQNNSLRYDEEIYRRRLQREIEIIEQMGYPGYFLIVWDFVRYARAQNIPVGPGRGSAAGSLVAFCLEITDVDPIEYDLLFERFLNPERVSMPDIDIDFCVRGREAVIQHVIGRYGRECVCQIITFGTMASKAVIKDVGRALGVPLAEVEKIAKLIPPPVRGRNVSITQAIEQVEELRQLIERNDTAAELIDLARRLEGCARHTSVHAAGIVISPVALHKLIPVANSPKSELTTQFAMSDLEKTGMLKMDFLALTTLTIINDCLNTLIKQQIEINWAAVKLDDAATMNIFGTGRTEAVFQFESPGMQEICRRLKPQNIEDLSALNALYRPGPLDGGMVDDFIARHRGQKSVRYIVPEMKDILHNTFGILVYQEQIMQLAQKLAGYSLGEADMMRRAMGKKKREEMAKHHEKFVQGATDRNIKPEKAEQIFNLMAQFADYGFNRSHSVAYAYLAFQTAYLKAHYPAHFYAAVLSHETQDAAKIYKYIVELQETELKLLPPDVNESMDGFTPLNKAVRFGLSAIKGLGEAAVQEIIRARGRQPFESLMDFAARVGTSVNRRGLESLICAGAFDSLNRSQAPLTEWRAQLSSSIEAAQNYAKKQQQDRAQGQNALFGTEAETSPSLSLTAMAEAWPHEKLWQSEKNALGFYLTSHPLDNSQNLLQELSAAPISRLLTAVVGLDHAEGAPKKDRNSSPPEKFWTGGLITALQRRTSKKGSAFAIFRLEDRSGHLKCLVWDEVYTRCAAFLRDDLPVMVCGTLEVENENTTTLIAEKVIPLVEAKPQRAAQMLVTLPAAEISETACERILAVLNQQRGSCQVVLQIHLNDAVQVTVEPHGIVKVQGSQALEHELRQLGCQVQWRLN